MSEDENWKKHTFGKCLRCNTDQVNVVSSEIQTAARMEKKKEKRSDI